MTSLVESIPVPQVNGAIGPGESTKRKREDDDHDEVEINGVIESSRSTPVNEAHTKLNKKAKVRELFDALHRFARSQGWSSSVAWTCCC
jgi:hypothetical protein